MDQLTLPLVVLFIMAFIPRILTAYKISMIFDEAYALSGFIFLDNIRKKNLSSKYWLIQFQPPVMMIIPALTYIAYIVLKEVTKGAKNLPSRVLSRGFCEARSESTKLILRLPTVIMGSLTPVLIFLLVHYVSNSPLTAFTAGVILALYPSFIGVTSVATLEGMVFWSILSILLLYLGVSQNSLFLTGVGGIILGLALGSKITGIFTPAIGLVWLALTLFSFNFTSIYQLFSHFILWIFTGVVVFYITWPILWSNPFRFFKLSRYLAEWHSDQDYGFEMYRSKIKPGSDYFISHLLTQMPNVMILLLPLGLLYPLLNSLNGIWLLAICGTAIPLVMLSLPLVSRRNARFTLSITYPFIAMIGCFAPSTLVTLAQGIVSPMVIESISLVLIFSVLIYDVVTMHPYYLDFFNILTGGLNGAKDKYIVFGVGEGLEDVMKYIDENAPTNSVIWAYVPRTTAYFHVKRLNLEASGKIDQLFYYSPTNPNPLGYKYDATLFKQLREGDLTFYFPYYHPEKDHLKMFQRSQPDLVVIYRRFSYPGVLDQENKRLITFLSKQQPSLIFVKKNIEVAYVYVCSQERRN